MVFRLEMAPTTLLGRPEFTRQRQILLSYKGARDQTTSPRIWRSIVRNYSFLFLFCLFAGPAIAQVSCNDFEVDSKVVGKNLEIKVTSDLPDDALINISVTRRYWRKGDSKAYSFEYFAKEKTMKELRGSVRMELSEAVLKKVIKNASEMNEMAGRSAIKVDRLDVDVKLRVTLTMNQKNEDFGEYNRNLQGRAVKQIDAYRGVKVFRRIPMSVVEGKKKPPKKKAPTFKAINFIDGGCYVLREKFELFNHFEAGADGARATVGHASKRGIVYVHRRVKVGDELWFRVGVISHPDAKDISFGWTEVQAFGRKKHREFDSASIKSKLQDMNWLVPNAENAKYKSRGPAKVVARFKEIKIIEGVIILPDGLAEADAKGWALRAAWDILEKTGARSAILKVAREGDDLANSGAAWVLPETVSDPEFLQPKHLDGASTIRLKGGVLIFPAYFKERPKSLGLGTEVFVKKEGSFEVHIFTGPTWKEGEKAKFRVAKGTSGVIEKVHYLDVGGKTILRYLLKLEGNKSGWAQSEYVFKF
ncbi:MAG: hypothetical protein ACI97A_003306 [Planctomycetota bacterium]